MGICFGREEEVDWVAVAQAHNVTATTTPAYKHAQQTYQAVNTDNAGPTTAQQAFSVKVAASTMEDGGAKAGAHHLKNVFAKPLQLSGSYRPPVYAKSREEEAFIKAAMERNFVFAKMTDREESTLIKAFEKLTVKSHKAIISQGDEGDYFYIMESGRVRFEVNGEAVGFAGEGKSFGELSLLYTSPRAASCIAEVDCVLWRLDQKTFRYILQSQTVQSDTDKKRIVKNIDFLKDLDESDLNKLTEVMSPRPFSQGEQIVKKGTEGDTFFIVDEGTVMITDIEVGDAKFEDRILKSGDYFGERALVTREPRVANVYGKSDGVCWTVDALTFQNVLGSLDHLVLKAQDKRVLGGIKCLAHTDLDSSELSALADLVTDKFYRKGSRITVEGELTYATLYLVRDGQVNVTSTEYTEYRGTFTKGGFIGEDQLTSDARGDDHDTRIASKYTMSVVQDTTLGCLRLIDARDVLDTTRIGQDKPKEVSVIDLNITLESLKKHTILGAGTFGQVWLVSRVNSRGETKAYALKIQSKLELIKSEQAKGVVNEKKIMSLLNNQFIIKLAATFQDPARVYILLKLVQGGELYSVLHQDDFDGVAESSAKFYAAGILEGMTYMHRRSILFRDLKPENVLIDKEGYPVLIDLGFAKLVKGKTFTLCGTPLYIAPEVVLNRGHDMGADHWSLGVLIYEMIAGYTPFYEDGMDQITLFKAIIKGDFEFPTSGIMSADAESTIIRFLVTDPYHRLGSLAKGIRDIYREAWFSDLDFDSYRNREIDAPWKPDIADPLDSSNFDSWDHLEDKSKAREPKLSSEEQAIFKDF